MDNDQSITTIANFSGSGKSKTKPFNIPENALWFTIYWDFGDHEGLIEINYVHTPNDPIESLAVESSGSSIVYGVGTFYLSIATQSDWAINVVVEADAWSADQSEYEDNVSEDSPIENSSREAQRMNIDNWYCIFATYDESVVEQIRNNPSLNFVDTLDRGYILDESGQRRLELGSREANKIQNAVLELDHVMRHAFPDVQDNYPNGSPTFIRHIDERTVATALKNATKPFMDLSNVLRKAKTNSFYLFAAGKNRVQYVRVSAESSIQQRNANRDAAAAQWQQFYGPKQAASAWFDEANRRGF